MKRHRKQIRGTATLGDVAAAAGVSTATASLILSGRPERLARFRKDTIDEVRRAAERLRYRANLFASTLSQGTTPFFGLVVRDFGRQNLDSWHHWAFEGQFLAGIAGVAAEKGLYPILATIDPNRSDAGIGFAERVVSGGVCGAIVRAQNPPLEAFLRSAVERGCRVVVVFPDQISHWKQNAIVADNVAIGETAAKLLLAAGCRTLGFVRYPPVPKGLAGRGAERGLVPHMYHGFRRIRESHQLRLDGFRRIARRAETPVREVCVPRDLNGGATAAEEVLRSGADGFFGADSVLSVNCLLACRRAGLDVGTGVRIVGVNCSQWQTADYPKITSIDISWREVGRMAIEKLIQLVEADALSFPTIAVKPAILTGGTCPVRLIS